MTEYEKQARDFLKASGARMEIRFQTTVKGFPFDNHDNNLHDCYLIKLYRGGKSYSFKFYASAADYLNNRRPSVYDVLACVEKYETPRDVWEFADEYGYQIDSRESYKRVERICKACRTQYEKLVRLFGEYMEGLQEIN